MSLIVQELTQTNTLHSSKTCHVKHVEKEILINNPHNNKLYSNSSYDFQNNQHQRLIVDSSLTLHPTISYYFMQYMCCSYCEGGGDVVGVGTPLVGGVAQAGI